MKVYLAAPYAARDLVRRYQAELHRIGFDTCCRWLDESHEINAGTTGPASALPDDQVAQYAADDLADVQRADLFVLLTEKAAGVPASSGGRHVETGYFIANNGRGRVIVVGQPENIFHRLGGVTVVPDWHEAVIELSARLVEDRFPEDRFPQPKDPA